MRDNRPTFRAFSPRLLFSSRCIELTKTGRVTVLSVLRRKPLQTKLVSFVLAINLFLWPGPILFSKQLFSLVPQTIDTPLSYLPLVLKSLLWLVAPAPQEDNLDNRAAAVARLRITPIKFVAYPDQTIVFSALPTDSLGRTVQGVKLTWRSSDRRQLSIEETGRATCIQPGLAWVTCVAGTVSATAPVLIKPGRRTNQTDAEWRLDQGSLNANGTLIGQTNPSGANILLASMSDKSMNAPWLRNRYDTAAYSDTVDGGPSEMVRVSRDRVREASESRAVEPTAGASAAAPLQGGGYGGNDFPNDFPYDELWSEPRNLIGSPRNRIIEPTRIGPVLPESSNFQMSIPGVSVGGRGLGVSAGLSYNGKVWFRHGNAVTFDAIQSWPSPGFTLGFGRIVAYGPANATKYMLIDPSGTRRYLGVGGPRDQNVTLQTADGTHITYVGNGSWGGTLYYTDGTRAAITLNNNRLVTSQVTDANGNYFTINYLDVTCEEGCFEYCYCAIYWPPLTIAHIIDSLGRIIQFNYDSELKLISVTAPGFGGTVQNPVTQTVVQFDYESRAISGSFSGLTVENRPTESVSFIKHIYYPATQTGLLFNYSSFGMATSVSLRRQMTINGSVITDGVESGTVSFNYPQSGTLTDAPAFTQRTENPGGTFSYATSDDPGAQTRTITITLPDTTQQQPTASQMLLTRSTNASSIANGLLVQSEIKRGSTSYAKSVPAYANDPGGYPQTQSVIAYNDAGAGVKTDFDFDQYGNVTNKREYGYQIAGQWQVRRRTRLTYKTDAAYINEYLRSLVTQIEVMDALENTNDADDVVMAKTSMTFDDYQATGGMEDYGGTAAPPGHLTSYDATKTVRGNVTGHTEWSDIAGNISTTRLSKFDIFGNVVVSEAPCCDEKSFTNTADTYWSVPQQSTSGPLAGVHLTSSATYDFNTGATKTQTDPNNLTTSYGYDAAMRNTTTTLPIGIVPTISYNDATLSSSSHVQYWENDVQKTISTSSVRDGWSRTIQEVNKHGGQVNTTYDAMGRVVNRTNPFVAGGQPGPATSYQYDSLGRVTVMTLPDNQTIQTTYSGSTVTVTDQVSRKIKRETDGLGRLIKVTEQDETGTLTQETSYFYNVMDKLTGVNQGNQTRAYKYDALGRLLYERIPEQTATINDGTGAFWTSKYTHTDFDAVATKQDARGVITTYSYDNLHRLTGISYNISGAPGVASTPGVTFTYDTSDTSSTKGLLLSVDVGTSGSVYRESYTFDSFNRVSAAAHRIEGRTYTTSFEYNAVSQPTRIAHIYPEYDDKARLFAVPNGVGGLFNVNYNIAGQVTSDQVVTNGGYVSESFGYDANRMQLTTQTATKSGNSLMNLTYNYQASAGQMGAGTTAGNAGQLMSISGTINGTTESAAYSYDNLGRLVTSEQTSNGASAQRRFSYDRWGNRTGVWNAVTGGSQIQSLTLQQNGGAPTNQIEAVYTHEPPQETNFALASNGATAVASSSFDPSYLPSGAINGDRKGTNWGGGGGWMGESKTSQDWIEVDFADPKTIDEIDVFTVQDNYANPSEPTENMTFSLYGIVDFQVQYWNGSAWATVSGGNVTGNNKVWKKVSFPELTTSKIRVNITNALGYARVTEVEAWGPSFTGVSYAYDAAGNVTNDGVHSYQYDAENRLVSVDNGATAQYKYDHQNRRIKKVDGGSNTDYKWEGSQVISEYNGSTGAQLVAYYYAGSRMISKLENGAWRYFLSDRLSTRVVLDLFGNVVGRQAHLPFGDDFAESGTQEKHHFTSYERDAESAVDYAINRNHSPNIGRFQQADSYRPSRYLVNPQSWNRYAYVQNNPTNAIDPLGLYRVPFFGTTGPPSPGCMLTSAPWQPGVMEWDCPGGAETAKDPIQGGGSKGANEKEPNTGKVYRCTRPLGEAGSKEPCSGELCHEYLCADKNGKMECWGLNPSKNLMPGLPGWVLSPGVNNAADQYHPENCTEVSSDFCMSKCVRSKFNPEKPPVYGYGPQGTDCHEWADDTIAACVKKCQGAN